MFAIKGGNMLTQEARDRDIVARKARGESSFAIGRRYGLSSTRINQIYNVSRGKCHYWRSLVGSQDTDQLKIMRQIERLPLSAQSEIHRWLEHRAPRDEMRASPQQGSGSDTLDSQSAQHHRTN
jgi:hypothetical protein